MRVALSFARKVDTDLIAFVRNVLKLLTNNAQYPAPTPTLALLATSVDGFETAVHDGVEAAARTGVTSQAREARRNYMMSWPQHARETDQRAKLKSQVANNAAVMAGRPNRNGPSAPPNSVKH